MSAGVGVDWDGSERETVLKVRKRKKEREVIRKVIYESQRNQRKGFFWLVQR